MNNHLTKDCINAIAGAESPEIQVIQPVHAYSLRMIHVCINDEKFCVNESVFDSACKTVVSEHTRVLTGYGTGGASALVLALMHKLKKNKDVTVCSFGSPAIGDVEFNNLACKLDHRRVKISSDPISTQGFGMNHPCPALVIGNSFPSCVEKFMVRSFATMGFFSSSFDEGVYIKVISRLPYESSVIMSPKQQCVIESSSDEDVTIADLEKGDNEWGVLDPLLQDLSSDELFDAV